MLKILKSTNAWWVKGDKSLVFMLYLSGCFCCLSGFLTGCVQPGEGPGRTGWASHDQRGRRWGLFPCSSSPSLHDGSRDQEASGPSGCLFFCWRCGSPSSCTQTWQAVSEEVNRSISGLVQSIKLFESYFLCWAEERRVQINATTTTTTTVTAPTDTTMMTRRLLFFWGVTLPWGGRIWPMGDSGRWTEREAEGGKEVTSAILANGCICTSHLNCKVFIACKAKCTLGSFRMLF